jgi:hypothetical protein
MFESAMAGDLFMAGKFEFMGNALPIFWWTTFDSSNHNCTWKRCSMNQEKLEISKIPVRGNKDFRENNILRTE